MVATSSPNENISLAKQHCACENCSGARKANAGFKRGGNSGAHSQAPTHGCPTPPTPDAPGTPGTRDPPDAPEVAAPDAPEVGAEGFDAF